jgi:FkbM family methyltransferase
VNNGVVHVGAHKGQEVPQYIAEGRAPIICFEPQPLHSEIVGAIVVPVALSDYEGTMTMRIPHHLHATTERDTQSASGLPLIKENAVANGWTPTPWDTLDVPVCRFDEWAKEYGFNTGSCSYLAIDVQGMELQVLKGFGDFLGDFSELKVECSSPPLYEGGADAKEVVEYLRLYGFRATTPVVRHGDIHFTKEK